MKTFILMFALAGQPTAQLGSYETEALCTDAIRQIYLANIYVGARDNPQVLQAIETTMKYQQEYICVKSK